jgi:hypothetical protein
VKGELGKAEEEEDSQFSKEEKIINEYNMYLCQYAASTTTRPIWSPSSSRSRNDRSAVHPNITTASAATPTASSA